MHHSAIRRHMSAQFVVNYETSPEHYRHWTLSVDGVIATLTMKVDEDGGLKENYPNL